MDPEEDWKNECKFMNIYKERVFEWNMYRENETMIRLKKQKCICNLCNKYSGAENNQCFFFTEFGCEATNELSINLCLPSGDKPLFVMEKNKIVQKLPLKLKTIEDFSEQEC